MADKPEGERPRDETVAALAEIYGPAMRWGWICFELCALPAVITGVCWAASSVIGVGTSLAATAILCSLLPIRRAVEVIKKRNAILAAVRAAPDPIRDEIAWLLSQAAIDREWEPVTHAHLLGRYWIVITLGATPNEWATGVTGEAPPALPCEGSPRVERFFSTARLLGDWAEHGLIEPDREAPAESRKFWPTPKGQLVFDRIAADPEFVHLTQI